MAKCTTFEELKLNRKKLVDVVKENGMLDGLTRLLTELYPDEAHFIYELLQNAEDKEATQVTFKLFSDRLIFAHNGSKRDFILDDIDAITNIGQSTKIDDPTSIGKFGVGFKAVYAYTNTPEIHSGRYDFKIKNMLIPDDENVRKVAESGKTIFVFPFDNPSKKPAKAVEEIKTGLLALNENSIIFLKNIKDIRFILPDGKIGGISVKEKDSHSINRKIIHVNAQTQEKKVTYWNNFTKVCKIDVDNQTKTFPVSIAFRMKKVQEGEETKLVVDSSLKGNVCIYFPAVKEDSNLHFHINAPFASTVARDSVRFCDENDLLIKEIAHLTVQAMYYYKTHNMLDMNVYATLPNGYDFDDEDSPYYVIYETVYKEFKKQELILTSNGEYKKIVDVLQANRDITKLISNDEIKELYQRSWIPAAPVQSREYNFFQDLGVAQFTSRSIIDEIRKKSSFFDKIFENKEAEWFRDWYALLNDIPAISIYTDVLSNVKMIKADNGNLYKATDSIFIFNPLFTPKKIKDPIYVSLPKSSNQNSEKAKKFLILIGVKEMAEDVDMFYNIEGKSIVDTADGLATLLDVIEFYKKTKDVSDFVEKDFFFARALEKDDSIYVVKAKECCWSEDVAFFYQNDNEVGYVIELEEYSGFSIKEKELMKEVFIALGGKVLPQIVRERLSWNHPQYKQLNTDGERVDTCTKKDYVLTGYTSLHLIKERSLYKESKLLWDYLVADKNMDHHRAVYQANAKSRSQILESTVAYYLRRLEWIPNAEGVFCRPCDVTEDTLYEGFKYSKDAVFLHNIGFGDKLQAPNDMVTALKKAGIKISTVDEEWLRLSDKDKQEFLNFMQAKARKLKERMSFEDALGNENKDQVPYDDDDFYGVDVGIKNVAKRKEKQRQEFEEGLEISPKKQQVWRYTFATKKNGPEKQFVQEQYHGKCQICGRNAIRKANGQQYFEAINIIDTSGLDEKYQNNLGAGWNTLSLCPNCAAEYRYCQKNLSDLQEQIASTKLEDRKSEMIDLFIILKNERTKISFTPRHFLALQTAFEIFKENGEKE